MGILNATNIRSLQNYSELPEVLGKSPTKLQQFIDRAEALLSRVGDFDTSLPGCTANLELAVNMLAENLIILSTPDFKRSAAANLRSETIGSYSYSTRDGKGPGVFSGITEEILLLLGACKTTSSVRYSRTNVFVPRTVRSVLNDNELYYIPEDQRVEEIATGLDIDPEDPRQT